ncbi:hypothetical protein AVEN_92322-1 [Araneus ventricosus]|uniref:Uncharacterized protein n=1 Tax=Araneus ventricosus TaxID=182803 RepID=A0A4Y2AMG5_ARAVE|nr:hypothetical protein AVEN_92322-1 [Araneus ventricosus]
MIQLQAINKKVGFELPHNLLHPSPAMKTVPIPTALQYDFQTFSTSQNDTRNAECNSAAIMRIHRMQKPYLSCPFLLFQEQEVEVLMFVLQMT